MLTRTCCAIESISEMVLRSSSLGAVGGCGLERDVQGNEDREGALVRELLFHSARREPTDLQIASRGNYELSRLLQRRASVHDGLEAHLATTLQRPVKPADQLRHADTCDAHMGKTRLGPGT